MPGPKTISFLVTTACQNRCVFCFERGSARPHVLDADFLLGKVAERGPEAVDLAGGEPLLHPELPRILETLAAQGIRVTVTTNGLALADEAAAEHLARHAHRIVLSVHAATARDYAEVTGNPSGFQDLKRAISNLEAVVQPGQVLVNTTVTRATWERAELVPRLVAGLRPAAWHVTNPMPIGAARRDYGRIVPRIARVRERIRTVAETALGVGIQPFFGFFPACALGEYADRNTDLLEPGQACGFPVDRDLNPHQIQDLTFERVFPEVCGHCPRRETGCAGVASRYVERFGTGELAPTPIPIPIPTATPSPTPTPTPTADP